MSKVQDGTYYIINRVESPNGERLCITFNGEGQPPTVTAKRSDSAEQKWRITTFSDGRTQSIVPAANTGLECAWGPGVVTVLTPGQYVWTIRSSEGGYTIKDGGETQVWGLNVANVGSQIAIGNDTELERQRWTFHEA
ncbi:hypothetical protein M407DRAFT_10511 [Tulasnella calospora MUT 4182]|uniref:CCL2-like lectin domain-containing protein n=1 Tax=Tulasnella calospora MUT 4182 TaxID=1051891 RepID=A0A0C3Q9D0_9AGAM|nr:hypothetical protein M407DRAFT_10511 [Tulasnella calospora MUT 4182]